MVAMRHLENEFGEYEILSAARLMNEGKYDDALKATTAAALRPKVNRINLRLLETAIRVEKGDFSPLEDTCNWRWQSDLKMVQIVYERVLLLNKEAGVLPSLNLTKSREKTIMIKSC